MMIDADRLSRPALASPTTAGSGGGGGGTHRAGGDGGTALRQLFLNFCLLGGVAELAAPERMSCSQLTALLDRCRLLDRHLVDSRSGVASHTDLIAAFRTFSDGSSLSSRT